MSASPVPRSAAAPAPQTLVEANRQAVPQGHGLQPFVPSASPTQQMSSLRQTTPAHATSRQFQHQSPKQRPVQHPVNTGSIARSPAHPVPHPQSQAQHTFLNSPTQSLTPPAISTSPAPAAKRQAGEPAFGYNGLPPNGSHRQQELASFSSQRRSQEHTAIASATAPSFAHHLAQYATPPRQISSPVAYAQLGHHSNYLTSPHATSRKQEQRLPQQQASKPTRNANQQQADVQLPSSGPPTNHAAKPHPVPTQMTTSPNTAPKHTSASINTPKMSSTTHTLSPDKSSTLAASSPAKAEPAFDYRPVAMRMLQKQIKDHEPIVLGGVKITSDDVTTSMNGCIRKLTTALQLQAEEVARKEAEEVARKKAEETAHANSKDASQGQAETTDEIAALAVSNENEGHELDYLFSDTPIPASHSHPIDFGNVNDYLFSSSPDSPDRNEWRPDFMPDLPPNFGKMDLAAMTQRAFKEEPTGAQQDDPFLQPPKDEDTLADLSYPEAWFIEDVEDFVTSGPLPEWMQLPETDFALEKMEGSDGDLGMPGDPEDWLQATRVWREEREKGREADRRGARGGVL